MSELLAHYQQVRQRSLQLVQPLSAEDACVQSMPQASPAKWHLAHTTWFFETFVLEPHEPGFAPFQAAYKVLFNSYYNAVGAKHPRPQRGLLTRPSLSDVLAYRAQVDARMQRLLGAAQGHEPWWSTVVLGLHHEQQHQELILTDLLHLLSCNPLHPAYAQPQVPVPSHLPQGWVEFAGGLVDVGHAGDGFCFDNELPRHPTYVAPFSLATHLVSNADYLRFVQAGGYEQAQYWLSDGWDWLQSRPQRHPVYWQRSGTQWLEFTLAGLHALQPQAAVQHVSYYEADAYARWAQARLPTEFEWELAAPHAALSDMLGTAWQWTQSAYAPYPGFAPAAGAVGEYNGKFMVNQYVLRGSSSATPLGHARVSYRNFFAADATWQFTGIRLARSRV